MEAATDDRRTKIAWLAAIADGDEPRHGRGRQHLAQLGVVVGRGDLEAKLAHGAAWKSARVCTRPRLLARRVNHKFSLAGRDRWSRLRSKSDTFWHASKSLPSSHLAKTAVGKVHPPLLARDHGRVRQNMAIIAFIAVVCRIN